MLLTNWLQYVVPGLLIAARLSGLLLIAPFFGSGAVPPRVKAGLVMAITLLLLPVVGPTLPSRTLLSVFGYGLTQLVIGALLGLVMLVVFEAAELAGQVASFQLGLSMETSIDPTTNASSTVLATFHQMVVLYIFLQLGVHRWVLRALCASFTQLPLGHALSGLNAQQLLRYAGDLWSWGLQIALPVLFVTLLIDVTLGFFAKAAPQLPVIFIGIPVKALCGYGVLIAAIRFWPDLLTSHFQQALQFFLQHAHA